VAVIEVERECVIREVRPEAEERKDHLAQKIISQPDVGSMNALENHKINLLSSHGWDIKPH
jgi:hypothetical protein